MSSPGSSPATTVVVERPHVWPLLWFLVGAASAGAAFVTGLLRGTLDQESFAFYLSQDAAYLTGYARALAALAVRAPSAAQAALWASASAHCELGEAELHRTWLANHSEPLDEFSAPPTRRVKADCCSM